MKNIETTIHDVKVVGKITTLDKYFIEVEIVEPYVNWKSCSSISGMARMGDSFLDKYEEVAERLLTDAQQKLMMIDESLDRIARVYDDVIEETMEVSKFPDTEIKERIISKLNDWFFGQFIFVSSVTGRIAAFRERDKIREIIAVYKKEKRKIYMKDIVELPQIAIDVKLKYSEESQVIFHCSFTGRFASDRIRIWKTTFLIPKESPHKCKLIYADNITFYPTWMTVPTGKTVKFLLVFSGLPKGCKSFDLVEQIPEPGAFEYKNIRRNKTDVYQIDMT